MKSPIHAPFLPRLISLFVAVCLLVAAVAPPGVSQAADSPPTTKDKYIKSPDGWITLMTEDFEGTFPTAGWHIGRTGDPYLWGKSTCHSHSGSFSLGSHMGGTLGSQLSCEAEYPLKYVTTLSYGPFDLTGCTDMRVNFSHLTKLALIDDYLSVGYSIDGGTVWSVITWGGDQTLACGGWCSWTLNAKSYPISLCGQPNVYLLFRFQSDWTDPGFGSWVDDVSLEALYGAPVLDHKIFMPLIVR